MTEKDDINQIKEGLANLFGFQPAETTAGDGECTLAYGPKRVVVDPLDYVNAAEAFNDMATELSLDSTDFVNYSRDGKVVAAGAALEAGAFYTATTKHDDKG